MFTATSARPPTLIATSDSVIPAICAGQLGWGIYVVQPGDTLYAIARAVGSSMAELRAANCIPDRATLGAGLFLSVPRQPLQPVQTSIPIIPPPTVLPGTPSDIIPLTQIGCTDPSAIIRSPQVGQEANGMLDVYGTADVARFGTYRIDILPSLAPDFELWDERDVPVRNGLLASINTDFFDDGLHYIRLLVYDRFGQNALPCVIPVIFR